MSENAINYYRPIADQLDNYAIRREFQFILQWIPTAPPELTILNQMYDHWIERAVELYGNNGMAGLEHFVDEFDQFETDQRRSSRTEPIARRFLDLFIFESKVCFYRCYAVLWQHIIPWLSEYRGLDLASERFLRFWHNQDPSIRLAQARGMSRLEADVFFGHILALHPLSSILMQTPQLRILAADCFTNAGEGSVISPENTPMAGYSNLVLAILLAGHIYSQNDRHQDESREVRVPQPHTAESPAVERVARDVSAFQNAEQQESLSRVATMLQFRCSCSNSALRDFACSDPEDSDTCTMTGWCARCETRLERVFNISDFADSLRPYDLG